VEWHNVVPPSRSSRQANIPDDDTQATARVQEFKTTIPDLG
jgi:hypothetical protein